MAHEFSVTTGTLPSGFCWSDPQTFLNMLPDYLTVNFDEPLAFFNFGNATPSPDYQDRPWIRTDANGFYLGTYVYANGGWFSRHPISPAVMVMFHDVASNILTLDGGTTTNPYWVPCDGGASNGNQPYTGQGNIAGNSWSYTPPDFRSMIPVCAGQGKNPLDSTGATLLTNRAFGAVGGEELHPIQLDELPALNMPFKYPGQTLGTSAFDGGATSLFPMQSGPTLIAGVTDPASPSTAITQALAWGHNNMQPFLVTNYIIRTPRVF